MKKYLITFVLAGIVALAGVASATWLGDFLRAGIDPRGPSLTFTDSFSVNGVTLDNSTDGDGIAVGDVNAIYVDTSAANVSVNGFEGGSEGQLLFMSVVDSTNQITVENNNSTSQPVYLSSGADETETGYGGWTFICNGTAWFEVEQ